MLKSEGGHFEIIPPMELTLLLALMGRPFLDRETASEILWPDPDAMPETSYWALHVHFYRLRKLITGSGWMIECFKNEGWRLSRA